MCRAPPTDAHRAHWFRKAAAPLLALLILLFVYSAESRIDRDLLRSQAQVRFGNPGLEAALAWLRLIDGTDASPIDEKLEKVNLFFNIRTQFRSDIQTWNQNEYWATPLETLARASGDCEDFAIAKYISLLALGVPQDQLRLIYVRAVLPGQAAQAHMVLGYYANPNAEPKILDNLNGQILPASQRGDLTPVFSFNGEGLWAGGIKAGSSPTARLSRWRNVLARIRQEGFQ